MVNVQKVLILLVIVLGLSAATSSEVFGQFGGPSQSTPQDKSTSLTKTRLTQQNSATIGSGIDRLSNPSLYLNRGYVAATIRDPSTRLAYFLWIRHHGLEDPGLKEAIQAEDYSYRKLGTLSQLTIRGKEFAETIVLSRHETQKDHPELLVRGSHLKSSEPVYLHLDLTAENPQLRRISPTWDNATKDPLTHEAMEELFVVIDKLDDSGELALEEIPPGDEEDEFAAQMKRGFAGFFD